MILPQLFFDQKFDFVSGSTTDAAGRKSQTILEQLYGTEYIQSRQFSLCLTEEGGELMVGKYNWWYNLKPEFDFLDNMLAVDEFLLEHSGAARGLNIQNLKVAIRDGQYFVSLMDVGVSASSTFLGDRQSWTQTWQEIFGAASLNTGETLSYFPKFVYNYMRGRVQRSVDSNEHPRADDPFGRDNLCYHVASRSNFDTTMWPVFNLRFDGINGPEDVKWYIIFLRQSE